MHDRNPPLYAFLRNRAALTVSLVLLCLIVLFNTIPTREYIPSPPPLSQFSSSIAGWSMISQSQIDDYTRNLLRADDTLQRGYQDPGGSHVELFLAFFKSQRAGVTPHSPRMCLVANGWAELSIGSISIAVPGEPAPIPVNRYVVTKDGAREVVFYYYENAHDVTANEYMSRLYLVYEGLRYHRSDEALVRVITQIGNDEQGNPQREQDALRFIHDFYQPIRRQIWSGPDVAMVR